MRIASASSSNGISAATGPKTSSRATRSSFVASTSVHGNQKPGPPGASPRKSGSASTKPATVSPCCAAVSGPTSVGEAGLEGELREPEGGERRQLGRLEDDRVAAGECGPELPGGDIEREVPGDDQSHDSERLAERHVDAAADGDRLAVVLVDGAGV